jgi:two-component system CitB family sensor kinase
VHVTETDAEVHMVITDTRPGIPRDALREIFVDGYSTKTPRGQIRRGLGLALVYRLVHRAGGSIEVTPGPGARFVVRLPIPGVANPTTVSSASLEPAR